MRRSPVARSALAAVLSLCVGLSAARAQSQSSTPVADTVEEDWRIVVASTDNPGVGPQITTCMSPVADPKAPFVAFDLNYREYPTFLPGGMQVQVWNGSNLVSTASQGTAQLATPNETITWTQHMSVTNGTVYYYVYNIQSVTWGSLNQWWNLLVAYTTTATSMAGYSPSYSVAQSGASWESNLVTSMTLVQVRYYANGVLIATDSTQRSVSLGN